jgi:hypothetical protein
MAVDGVESLCLALGTGYDTAENAVDALCTLDDPPVERAVERWTAVVEGEGDGDVFDDPRAGAMRALDSLAREEPSVVPVETFLSGLESSNPLVRLHASYGVVGVAFRAPARTRPHLDACLDAAERLDATPHPLGTDARGIPSRETPRPFDSLAVGKLVSAAFESALGTDDDAAFRRALREASDLLAGDSLAADHLSDLLPESPARWSAYADALDADGVPETAREALRYHIEWTCESWTWGDDERTTPAVDALATLHRAVEADDPDAAAPLHRAVGDLCRAWAGGEMAGDVTPATVKRTALHRRLIGRETLDGTTPFERRLERTADLLAETVTALAGDPSRLSESGVLGALSTVAAVAPDAVVPHVDAVARAFETAVAAGEGEDARTVSALCSRTVAQVGAATPEAVERVGPTAVAFLDDVLDADREAWGDFLAGALAGATVAGGAAGAFDDTHRDRFRGWCLDPPEPRGDPPALFGTVDATRIRYFAVLGLVRAANEGTETTLEPVASDPEASERVRELAAVALH